MLGRANVREAGLKSRITLLPVAVEELEDPEGFDLIWFPSFFIPEGVLDGSLRRPLGSLRPGGEIVVGVFDTGEDALARAVDTLVTVRSGGTPLSVSEAVARLERAGFGEARPVDRAWKAPLELVVGRGGA